MSNASSQTGAFRSVYRAPDEYDRVLPPHYYHGKDDSDLIAELMHEHYGRPRRRLRIADLGCGTGRLTAVVAPYAAELLGADDSPNMLERFRTRFPHATTLHADTRQAVAGLREDGALFDVIGAFWSLSYPIGDCYETITDAGIRPADDPQMAAHDAGEFIATLVRLLAADGHLLVLYFDHRTREQQLVTRAWQRLAPFPPGGRGYTLNVLLDGLHAAEDRGHGVLTHSRLGGTAVAANAEAARRWFQLLHFKSLPALLHDGEVSAWVEEFITEHTQPNGQVMMPSGVHVIDFHATTEPSVHLPLEHR